MTILNLQTDLILLPKQNCIKNKNKNYNKLSKELSGNPLGSASQSLGRCRWSKRGLKGMFRPLLNSRNSVHLIKTRYDLSSLIEYNFPGFPEKPHEV